MTERRALRLQPVLVIDGTGVFAATIRAHLGDAPGGQAFTVDAARGWSDGVAHVRRACACGRPYAVVFVEPPGGPGEPDRAGLEELCEADESLQVVVCRSAGDDRWHAESDRIVLLRPPPDAAEVRQLARVMTEKQRLTATDRERLRELEDAVASQREAIERADEALRRQTAERQEIEEQLRHLTLHDELTGLANRTLLTDEVERCLTRVRRQPGYGFAVLFVDVNNFKLINESLGHDVGDELLLALTRRLTGCLRPIDTVVHQTENVVARLGGDQFVVVLDGVTRWRDAAIVCERVLRNLARPFELNDIEVAVTASIGVALSEPGASAGALLRDADIALTRAKAAGKGEYALFDQHMHDETFRRLQLENELRRAIKRQEFRLVFQPVIALSTGRVCGFEALIRWDHPEHGVVSPGEFVAMAEETGLIVPIGEWVLGEACRQLRRWDQLPGNKHRLCMNVNLSRRQLLEAGIVSEVKRHLAETGLEPHRLNLEITETAVIRNASAAMQQLALLKEVGVGLQMDDFGTGYSSLSCLHRFPLDVIKIDRAFMATLQENKNYVAVVDGIITIAHNLDMQVTAEGIETPEQLAQILALSCDYGQGYLFARPLDAEAATKMIMSEQRWRMTA